MAHFTNNRAEKDKLPKNEKWDPSKAFLNATNREIDMREKISSLMDFVNEWPKRIDGKSLVDKERQAYGQACSDIFNEASRLGLVAIWRKRKDL